MSENEANKSKTMASNRQPSILLVDDDIAHRTMLKVNIQGEGYQR